MTDARGPEQERGREEERAAEGQGVGGPAATKGNASELIVDGEGFS